MRWRRGGRTLLVGAAAAVLLTGCIKLDADLQVRADDTIDGTVTIAISKEFARFLPGGLDDFLNSNDGLGAGPPGAEDTSVEEYEDDSFVGQTIHFNGAPLDDAGVGAGGPGDLTIERDGDRFVLSGELDLTADTGGLPFPEDALPDVSAMFDEAEIRVRVAFPGQIIEANGEVDGCAVTWSPEFGEVVELEATASATEGDCGSPADNLSWWAWLLILLGLLVLVGAIIAIVFSVRAERRRNEPAPKPPLAELPPAPPPFAPPSGAPAPTDLPPPGQDP